jgi:inorganic triphosphatase YgiF
MAEEIELKLALAARDTQRFLRHPLLLQAATHTLATLDNIYYDTPDLALQRRGIALRLRRQGRQWRQTVKLAGTVAAGLASRPEWETPYAGQFDFSAITDEKLRAWLQRPRLIAGLAPVFRTRFRRRAWRFVIPHAGNDGNGGAVLLTLDRGHIRAGEREEAISEIELELAGAPPQAIFDLALPLAERIPLAPLTRSKAERGYRLFLNTSEQPVKAPAIALSGELPPAEACRRIALACIDHLLCNREGAIVGADPEYIHQMRVAMRRLHAALRLFSPALPASLLTTTLKTLVKPWMAQLGRLRDLDVLHAEIVAPVRDALPDEPRLAALTEVIVRRRQQARAATQVMLQSATFGHGILQALQILHRPLPDAAPPPPPAEAHPPPATSLAAFATQRLRRLSKQLLRRASAAREDDPAALHALRIAGKRLRYALEFFAPLAVHRKSNGKDDSLRQLIRLQNTLGQLNDLAQAGALLADCAGGEPSLREAVTLIGGWHGPRYAALRATLPATLRRLTRLRPPRLR